MEVTQDISEKKPWNLATLIAFRFFFTFFFLNIFPFPLYYLTSILGLDNFFSFYYDGFEQLTLWTGKTILGLEDMPTGPNGSGDTTTDYVFQFVVILISLTATIIWSSLDYKRKSYHQVLLYFRTFVRYYVTFTMFSYGFYKIIPLQFSELSNFDLIKTVGDQSPMGLMWNFMEYSDLYTKFSGYAEVTAGVLLLFRKTTLFGALMTIAVMFNVFMMNMSYDIPVKLYSGLLTMMGMFLLAPDIKKVLDFFIFNRTIYPKKFVPYFSKKKLKISAIVVKTLVITYICYFNINNALEGDKKWGKKAPKSALYGIYEVDKFIKNKDTIPPLATDTIRWKRLIISKRSAGIQTMNEKINYLNEETDSIAKTLQLINRKDSTDIQSLSYKVKDSLYFFESVYECDTLKIVAKKKERGEFLLINRGFHWINEKPFNR